MAADLLPVPEILIYDLFIAKQKDAEDASCCLLSFDFEFSYSGRFNEAGLDLEHWTQDALALFCTGLNFNLA